MLRRTNKTKETESKLIRTQLIELRTAVPSPAKMPVAQRSTDNMGAKKKFGRNTSVPNKFVKQQQQQHSATATSNNERYGKSERDGLLLLSTKKSSGGLLSSKPSSSSATAASHSHATPSAAAVKPMPHFNLQKHNSHASTHQVLLSAVMGASHTETHTQPDAWGMADRQQQQKQQQQQQHAMTLAPQGIMAEESHAVSQEEKGYRSKTEPHAPYEEDSNPRYEKVEASWDEYGGRGGGAQSGKQPLPPPQQQMDEQYLHMSRLAKERAEARRQEEEKRFAEQRNRASQRLNELDQKAGRASSGGERKLWDPNAASHNPRTATNQSSSAGSMEGDKEKLIHLSSYEDRDRGVRNGSSAPRMLFDPKSGSMVEVKSREETSNSKRRERKPKQRKDRENKAATPSDGKKNPRKLKGRKDSISSEKSENDKKSKALTRLPRTCGVLYARNEKGNLYCVDECDGDLGYGCHSVPGGRVRNAEGYQKFVDEHAEIFQKQKELMESYEAGYNKGHGEDDNGLTLDTGFNLEEPPQPLEWVKADDKIELVTGADDSPTLKPTAKEWAPSQAALAAAAAAAAARDRFRGDVSMDSGDDLEEELDDEEEDAHSGLGFDPMQDMDFMSSPSHLPPEDAIASVDLKALTLEPSAFSSGDSATKTNIFAFGSTTWGASGSDDKGVLGWGSSGASETGTPGGLFGSDVFHSGPEENPAGLLSIPSTHSWGSSPIPGLNLSANHESTDG